LSEALLVSKLGEQEQMNVVNQTLSCQSDQIAAYLDGELEAAVSAQLEAHLKVCAACNTELAEQRLLLCTLNSTFGPSAKLALPPDFARMVAARAESDMSGVRDRREHKLALRLCVGLALAAFALLGVAASKIVLSFVTRLINLVAGIFDLGWSAIYDLVTGLSIVSRVLGRGLVPGSLLAWLIAFLLLSVALLLLSRLIAHFHRTRLVD
jgi:large-conductance mechanosensitive channel